MKDSCHPKGVRDDVKIRGNRAVSRDKEYLRHISALKLLESNSISVSLFTLTVECVEPQCFDKK